MGASLLVPFAPCEEVYVIRHGAVAEGVRLDGVRVAADEANARLIIPDGIDLLRSIR